MAKGNGRSSKRKKKSSSRRRLRMEFADSGRLSGTTEESTELPEPTEQELKVLEVMSTSLTLGDDIARAAARFLRDSLMPRMREGDEQPEEFDLDEFQTACDHLVRLRVIRSMLPLFGLEKYEREILAHFIDKAFNSKPSSSKKTSTVFHGDDEQFMDHMTRTQG